MLHIALCDSNKGHLHEIEKCLVAILFDKCDFEIRKFLNNNELVPDILNQRYCYDLIVTEQNTKPFSGMQIAKIVQKYRINTEVIFITEDMSCVLEGYSCRLFDYLVKPVSFRRFKNTINRYIDFSSEHYEHFCYKNRGKIEKVKLNDIMYFESKGRKVNLVTIHGKEEFYDKLDDVENALRVTFFVRVHQSYLVNLHHIKNIMHDGVVLDNGKVIPISRGRFHSVREKFINHISESN